MHSKASSFSLRLSCILEFLRVVDYPFPDWATAYQDRVETALGDAYGGPAEDVRGYIASIK
jgi:glutathione S-transferase